MTPSDGEHACKGQFIEIFKRLSRDDFMEDPARILSFMMDFGFERQRVWMLKSVLALDLKDFKGFFKCSPGSEDDAIDAIADYCLVSRDALSEIMHSMKGALSMNNVPTIIGEHNGEKCLVSDDGIVKYSLDLKTLLRVEDIDSFCIHDSVITIGDRAFFGCRSLNEVIIPDSVTSIGKLAFYGCVSLKDVNLPDSVGIIKSRAFENCESLERIAIPDSVSLSKSSVFSGRTSLKEVNIHSMTAIGTRAFYGCKSLKEIIIPDSVTAIGDNAFLGCKSLKEIIIPDSVTAIGDSAFSYCSSLEKIVIPDSVTTIGDYAFRDCSSLEKIIIPDSVTKIGKFAFFCCSSLDEIVIPDSVIIISSGILSGDVKVHLTVSPCNENFQSIDGCLYSKDGLELYIGYALVKRGMCMLPDSVTSIGDYAFSWCS